jgi:hypothetical protein
MVQFCEVPEQVEALMMEQRQLLEEEQHVVLEVHHRTDRVLHQRRFSVSPPFVGRKVFEGRTPASVSDHSYATMACETYWIFQMAVVYCPPLVDEVAVYAALLLVLPTFEPWLVLANKMHRLDIALVVSVCWFPLVFGVGCAIVREAQSMPAAMLVVLVQQTLICSIETVAGGSKCLQSPKVAHIGSNDHETRVESIRPTYVRCCREWRVDIE